MYETLPFIVPACVCVSRSSSVTRAIPKSRIFTAPWNETYQVQRRVDGRWCHPERLSSRRLQRVRVVDTEANLAHDVQGSRRPAPPEPQVGPASPPGPTSSEPLTYSIAMKKLSSIAPNSKIWTRFGCDSRPHSLASSTNMRTNARSCERCGSIRLITSWRWNPSGPIATARKPPPCRQRRFGPVDSTYRTAWRLAEELAFSSAPTIISRKTILVEEPRFYSLVPRLVGSHRPARTYNDPEPHCARRGVTG